MIDFIDITITGDGSCSLYPFAIALATWIQTDDFPIHEKRSEENFNDFLRHFSDFHPNFTSLTPEHFKAWVKEYAHSKRDMELLIGPVLRHWYHSKNTPGYDINQLHEKRCMHLGDEAQTWASQMLGINLFQHIEGLGNISVTEGFKGPELVIVHQNEHFEAQLPSYFVDLIDNGDSIILKRNQDDVNQAWDYTKNALPSPPVETVLTKTAQWTPAYQRNFDINWQDYSKLSSMIAKACQTQSYSSSLIIRTCKELALLKAIEIVTSHRIDINKKLAHDIALDLMAHAAADFMVSSVKEDDINIFKKNLKEELESSVKRSFKQS